MKPGDVVLVDTNVVIESHTTGCWAALTGGYKIETVDRCVVEAMTGTHNWNGTKPSETQLRGSFHKIHPVTQAELAQVKLNGGAGLDPGEQELWAHALAREDAWILCGPDRASMRFGYEQGQRNRLISLGALLQGLGHKPKGRLRPHFEQNWLDEVVRKLILGLL